MSLRRSARARVPSAADSDVVTPGEKRKRKRSTMTPETSQSPAKADSPVDEPMLDGPSSSSPSNGRPTRNKMVVKISRKSATDAAPAPVAPVAPSIVDTIAYPDAVPQMADLKTEQDAEVDEELQELHMSDEDRTRLQTVLQVYSPELMKQKAATGKGDKVISLQQILSHSSCSIRTVRNHLLALRTPLTTASALRGHLSSSHISPPKEEVEEDRKKLSIMTMALALVDEIAARTRAKEAKIELTETEKAAKRSEDYALHMRLPSGDYFTNAARLSVREAIQLDTGYSKLISVATQPLSLDTRPPPTLKDRLPRPKPSLPSTASDGIEEEIVKPVSHLYYNAWSSFAPTYDSFDGSLSEQASNALWRSKKDDRGVLGMMADEPMSKRELLEEMLDDLEEVDANAVMEFYDELKEPASLKRNAALLTHLDELQTQRWKRTFAKRLLTRSSLLEEPSEEEKKVAGQIMDTLSELISQQSGAVSQIVPSKETLRAASTSACIDPALVDDKGEPGYWGSLNENYYGPSATRRVTGARMAPVRPPAALRDNETIRMEPANEEKVSALMAQMGTTQKVKGMLDRFASERQYSLEDHPHDRKLVVAGSQAPSVPPSMPPQQQQQHQSYAHSHQMSPQAAAAVRPPGRPSMQYNMSPPSSTPPARPYHHPHVRPSPNVNPYQQQQQQQQKMGMYRPPANSRTWSQSSPQQQQQPVSAFYPAKPFAQDHRFVSGSPS